MSSKLKEQKIMQIIYFFYCTLNKYVISLSKQITIMKNEIIYKNRTIIEGTNGLFTAYYSNYSSNLTKDFKTLELAKNQIDNWLKCNA